ncbi:MAG TPA: histidine--tRNA ligase [candidate division Zixibacteria bacterium]
MKYTALQGTRDLLPEDASKWRYIEEKIRGVLSLYNYKEIRTPIFEQTELFKRSIGDDTDIVQKEMYTFLDQGKRSLTLRPEGTASIVRAFIEHSLGEKSPLVKLFYFGPMFRQERPQKGRLREFYQYGAEVIGSLDPLVDAELIDLGVRINNAFGLENLKLHLNSIGCKDCRPAHRDAFNKFIKDKFDKFCQECQIRLNRNPLRIFDCKNEGCIEALKDAPMILDYLDADCKEHFQKVRDYLEKMKIEYILDSRLVRGLDYYTRTTFEIKSESLGAQDTLIGGGRYDLLVSELGGKDTPAIGFAAGIERLIMVLEMQKKFPPDDERLDLFIAPLGDEAKNLGFRIVKDLREKGLKCDIDFLGRSLKSQLKEADRQKAKRVLIIGEDELKKRKGTLRDMESKEQKEIEFEKLEQELVPSPLCKP